jgi:hypothetical protein
VDGVSKLKSGMPYAFLIAVCGLLIFGTLNTGHDWGGDFAAYIMQADSLVDGTPQKFVEMNSFTIEHTLRQIGPVAYPWGFPAMLAPVYAWFGPDMIALKTVAAACYLLLLVVLAVGFRRQHSGMWLACLVGLFALNPALLMYANKIGSDVPFMFLSTLCVVLIGGSVVERRRYISPVWDGILLGVLIAASYFIRANGVVLLATLGITQAFVLAPTVWRRWSLRVSSPPATSEAVASEPVGAGGLWVNALPYVAFVAVLFVWRAMWPDGGAVHVDALGKISLGGIAYHLSYYGKMPVEFYDGAPYPFLIYAATLPLMIVGMIKRRRSDHPMIVYVALTFALYILWPATHTFRYLYPILPFYISFTLTGLQALQGCKDTRQPALRRVLCLLPVLFVLVCFGLQSTSNASDNLSRDRATLKGSYAETSTAMFSFIRESTDPDSTIVFFKPRVMQFLADRRAFTTPRVDEFWRADYLVVYLPGGKQLSTQDLDRLVSKGQAQQIYENSDFKVYRLTGIQKSLPGAD